MEGERVRREEGEKGLGRGVDGLRREGREHSARKRGRDRNGEFVW